MMNRGIDLESWKVRRFAGSETWTRIHIFSAPFNAAIPRSLLSFRPKLFAASIALSRSIRRFEIRPTRNKKITNFPSRKRNLFTGRELVSVYLRRGEYNVILVNWAKLAGLPWYVTAVRNTRIVGPQVARLVEWLAARGAVSLPDLHVIGFSLGAEIAGFMGKALSPRKVSTRHCPPFSPLFNYSFKNCRLRWAGSRGWTLPTLST